MPARAKNVAKAIKYFRRQTAYNVNELLREIEEGIYLKESGKIPKPVPKKELLQKMRWKVREISELIRSYVIVPRGLREFLQEDIVPKFEKWISYMVPPQEEEEKELFVDIVENMRFIIATAKNGTVPFNVDDVVSINFRHLGSLEKYLEEYHPVGVPFNENIVEHTLKLAKEEIERMKKARGDADG